MKFLVAIDGSSTKALNIAINLAKPDTTLVLLSVIEPLKNYYPELIMPTGDWVSWQAHPNSELEKALITKGRSLLDEGETICKTHGVNCETHLEFGSPRQVICQKAEGMDILIVGSR